MKNKQFNILWLLLEIVCVSLTIVFAILPMVNWLKIVLIILMLIASISVCVVAYKKALELIKQKNDELKRIVEENKQWTILDVYAFLGIQPQYKSNGELKDIFELLGIEKEYDEEGNRILTIYEKLGINPLFSKEGVEIPYVLRIKNRVNAFARAAQTAPLIYVPQSMRMIGQKPAIKNPDATKQEAPIAIQVKKETTVQKPKTAKPTPVNYGPNRGSIKANTGNASYAKTKTIGSSSIIFSATKPEKTNPGSTNQKPEPVITPEIKRPQPVQHKPQENHADNKPKLNNNQPNKNENKPQNGFADNYVIIPINTTNISNISEYTSNYKYTSSTTEIESKDYGMIVAGKNEKQLNKNNVIGAVVVDYNSENNSGRAND